MTRDDAVSVLADEVQGASDRHPRKQVVAAIVEVHHAT
jgi:hypothetical protein